MRRPWIVGAVVGVAVVAVVAAVAWRDDGSDQSETTAPSSGGGSSASSPPVPNTTTAADNGGTPPPPTGTMPPGPSDAIPPPGFTKVVQSFDHGEVTVFVPDSWTQVDRVQLGNGEPRLHVAPDVNRFLDNTFTTSGLRLDAFAPVHNDGLDTTHPKDTLDLDVSSPPDEGGASGPLTEVCTRAGEGEFPDDLGLTSAYSGHYARFTACRGAGSALVVVAGPEDRSYLVVMHLNTATPGEESALPVIAGSLAVRDFP